MMYSLHYVAATVVVTALAAGCQAPRPPSVSGPASPESAISDGLYPPPQTAPAGARVSATASAQPGLPERSEAGPPDMAAMLAELQAIGALDPAAQQQLMEDLKQTDPRLWPQLMQAFRASMAYRRQNAERPGASAIAVDVALDKVPESDKVVPIQAENRQSAAQASEQAGVASASDAIPTRQALEASPAQPAVADSGKIAAMVGGSTGAAAEQAIRSPPPTSSEVIQASYVVPAGGSPETWQDRLAGAIHGLEEKAAGPGEDRADLEARLRMLYLVAQQREDALRPISGLPSAEQEFWSKQLYGLSTYLDVERNTDAQRRAAEAALHIRSAAERLGEAGSLVVRNLTFCTEVSSYGVYKKFEKLDFKPGQEVILYAEVENFQSRQSDKGYHTALKSSYHILDSRGARVTDQEFAVTEEHCLNQRRDFFIRYFLWIPKRIYDGTYTLQLTIEDCNAGKVGQSSIQFAVKEK